MNSKRAVKKHTVAAQVQILDLTKAGSSMELKIYASEERIGTIILGRGSLVWRGGRKQRERRFSWSEFAELMNRHAYGE